MPYILADKYQYFGGTAASAIGRWWLQVLEKTSVTLYHQTQRHVPKDSKPHMQCRELTGYHEVREDESVREGVRCC
jgi:hypothetical protein